MMTKILIYAYCAGGVTQDAKAVGGGRGFPGAGGGEPTRFPYAYQFGDAFSERDQQTASELISWAAGVNCKERMVVAATYRQKEEPPERVERLS